MTIPDKTAVTRTFILSFLFCLPLAGTKELFLFLVAGQIIFMALVFINFRKDAPSLLMTFKNSHPKTLYLFIGWLIAISISLTLVFTSNANGWQRAFAIARQFFILIEIGYCLSLMRFILVTNTSFHHLLLSFGMGFIGLACLHFAILYWGPACESETWLKDPFLSPNMRDIGDLATAAISIFTISYFFSKKSLSGYGFLGLLTICWAYLFWSGGRTAIASAVLVNFLIRIISEMFMQMLGDKHLEAVFSRLSIEVEASRTAGR